MPARNVGINSTFEQQRQVINAIAVDLYNLANGATGYAFSAGISTYSSFSGVSTYSSISGFATYSNVSGFSTYSSYSTYSGISTLSGSSTYSVNSGIASIAQNLPSSAQISIQNLSVSGISTFSNVYLNDNGSINFGDSGDLKIYHTGSASRIFDKGTGNLQVTTNGSEISLLKQLSEGDTGEYLARFLVDGGVELYHDNVKKLEVNGSGVVITGILTASSISGSITASYANVAGIATNATNAVNATNATNAVNATNATNATNAVNATNATNATNAVYSSTSGIASSLISTANINTTGIVTAALFVGDGSGLSGLVASGTGIIIKDSGTLVGTASTIDFGDNLTVSAISAGIVTVTGAAGGGGGSSQWVTTNAGIHTLSNVGIGTTNPLEKIQIERYALSTGIGTFSATVGVAFTFDSFTISSKDFKSTEYLIHVQNGSNIQSQKVLVMQNGTTAYSQEYAIMFNNVHIVSVGATISSGVCQLRLLPSSGISGLTTYRFKRGGLI